VEHVDYQLKNRLTGQRKGLCLKCEDDEVTELKITGENLWSHHGSMDSFHLEDKVNLEGTGIVTSHEISEKY